LEEVDLFAELAKRSVEAKGDWKAYVSFPITDVVKPSVSPTTLYIIIGVVAAVALIITVILVISLSRNANPEYQPLDSDRRALFGEHERDQV